MIRKYKEETFTYGAEIELGNFSTKSILPNGATHNNKDYTCMNSNGIGNDPSGKLYTFGGEINTAPHSSIDNLVNHIGDILTSLQPTCKALHRHALHIHIKVPDLINDVETLKHLTTMFQENAGAILHHCTDFDKQMNWSKTFGTPLMQRWVKQLKSNRTATLSSNSMGDIARSKTPDEYFAGHAPQTKDGKPLYHLCKRSFINMLQLLQSGTIEFRLFAGTTNIEEIRSAIETCNQLLLCGLNADNTIPLYLKSIISNKIILPKVANYDDDMEFIYNLTSYEKVSKIAMKDNLTLIRGKVDIDSDSFFLLDIKQQKEVTREIRKILEGIYGSS